MIGEGTTAQIRACASASVGALGITDSPASAPALSTGASLAQNPMLTIYASGCPNSCAQHQIADIGLAGSKARIAGETVGGYQVLLGAELDAHQIGEVVGCDHMVLGMISTALPAINAIPAVFATAPGIVTYLDLPLVTARGFAPTG